MRVSSFDLTKKDLNFLQDYLFSGLVTTTINKPWHLHSKMPISKKYEYRIVSKSGIVLGVKKRAKYKGVNQRYAYDIMIDLTGVYFADLSLLRQINLINYLNSNFKLKCNRIDVAIDDYSRKLFPVGQMITAFLEGNQWGFQVIDDDYIDIADNKLSGTLGVGSRESSLFIRIYTKHKVFIRWETELKKNKAQNIFDKLANFGNDIGKENLSVKAVRKTMVDAALGGIDFRDKSSSSSPKNTTRVRTKQLPFWSRFISNLFSFIENKTNNKYSVTR